MRRWRDILESRRVRWTGVAALSLAGAAGIGYAVVRAWPTPAPDVWEGYVPDVAMFVMDKDFNRLPARERLAFLRDFLARFRQFDQNDAAMLAGVMARINYEMRKQVEENMIRLAVDLSREYDVAPPEERERYLRELIVEFDKMADFLANRERDVTDEERLLRIKGEQDRMQERVNRDGGSIQADRITGFFGFYQAVSEEVSGADRGRLGRMRLDASRYLKGLRDQ